MFSTIQGYKETKTYLSNIVRQAQMPHAQLFAGRAGGASLSLAHSCIAFLHCMDRGDTDPCGRCTACLKLDKLVHPDLHLVFPIGRTGQIKGKVVNATSFLPTWRSFIQENPYGDLKDWCQALGNEPRHMQISKDQVYGIRHVISKKPFESNFKTVLIWLPEHMHRVAANAMLKMVEEPTPNTFFFFVTLDAHLILPTLQSRTCTVHIPLLDTENMYKVLQTTYSTHDPVRLSTVIHIAQGNLGLAKRLLAEKEGNYFDHFSQWIRQIYGQKLGNLVALANAFHEYPAQVQKNWVIYALQLLRESLISDFQLSNLTFLSDAEATFCQKFNRVVNFQKIEFIIQQLLHLGRVLERNANAKLAFINNSLRIASFFQST